ncbi:Nramp family divalent metal transporter [Sporolituus thermophilus]|uniref:NRAMP (Natural resistance-associated macrophage protein) metal ion transporters n=1 Tax=Sporolituus thermophilus DSM 23256 TaxID=1123285 RepID=A0A1G7KY35_9FIRM|nr:Nramp family divalent metal transporter [Sporolituus thermophilus]SDF42113.1 NRAMP (natural resistance-associated macrophage protein) metal ion transporters [Sporolituus thermophilus DSM 23256]
MKEEQLASHLPLQILPETREMKAKAKGLFKYLGPAFIVSVAYMDPGNFGTNISGGTQFGYNLLWVILWSNLMAIFVQIMSAKLGIATGVNLPNHCGQIFSRPVNWGLWSIATVAAMATDLAEFLGGKSEETPISNHNAGNKGLAIAVALPVVPGFRQCVDTTHGYDIR